MDPQSKKPILIVEDEDIDYQTALAAFRHANFNNPLYRCEDGQEALQYLFREGMYADAAKSPRPSLILLDLYLPRLDGFSVLERIRESEQLRRVPVFVLTGSDAQDEVERCYDLGANSYIVKPIESDGLVQAFTRMREFVFQVSLLPKTPV